MDYYCGFDPGGVRQFGWAVLSSDDDGAVQVCETGCADNAMEVVMRAINAKPGHTHFRGAGIDSPLYWTPTGVRAADRYVRNAAMVAGCRTAGGTVQHPNSLRGACVIQGPVSALLLRRHHAEVQITEAHPKAMLYELQGNATYRHVTDQWVGKTEHERDAVLGALAAWAMCNSVPGWVNLFAKEDNVVGVVPPPLGYWFPTRRACMENGGHGVAGGLQQSPGH
jgi:predicted nuclease with RNAse H fold